MRNTDDVAMLRAEKRRLLAEIRERARQIESIDLEIALRVAQSGQEWPLFQDPALASRPAATKQIEGERLHA